MQLTDRRERGRGHAERRAASDEDVRICHESHVGLDA